MKKKIIEDFMKINVAILPKYNFFFSFFLKNSFVLNMQMVIANSKKKLKRLELAELQTYVCDHNFFPLEVPSIKNNNSNNQVFIKQDRLNRSNTP